MKTICNVYGDIEMVTAWDVKDGCYYTRSIIIDPKTGERRVTAEYPSFNKDSAAKLHYKKCFELNRMMFSIPSIDGEPYACNQEN